MMRIRLSEIDFFRGCKPFGGARARAGGPKIHYSTIPLWIEIASMNRNGLVQMMIKIYIMVMTYRRRRFPPKIHVLECDSAMEIQSFLFAKSKKIRLRRTYWNAIFIHEAIVDAKKRCSHLFMDQLSVARPRGLARARVTPRKKSISDNLTNTKRRCLLPRWAPAAV